jgi:ABC-type transport system involved in cytochrome bd biosynthesis fused ATPase/permease subunit
MGPGSFFRLVACVFIPALLGAQTAGVSSQWDLKTTVESVSRHTSRLRQILDELRAKDWVAAGASSTYVQQLDSAKTQTTGVQNAAANLEREPEKLSLALDTFLRLQGLEAVLSSLVEGTRKYQNPALADLISGIAAENSSSRQKLRQYVVDLAALKEEEYRIMDQEAQRCRGLLTQQPRPAAAPAKKKTEGK